MTSWCVVLEGAIDDLDDWAWFLKPPFDPNVTWLDQAGARHAISRAAAFEGLNTSQEVYDRALLLVERLAGGMMLVGEPSKMKVGAVAEFRADGRVGFCHVLVAQNLVTGRPRFGRPILTVRNAEGQIIPRAPPSASPVQVWSALAADNDVVADMLTHFARADNWFDLYKTWELAKKRIGGEHTRRWKAVTAGLRAKAMSSTANFYRHATTSVLPRCSRFPKRARCSVS